MTNETTADPAEVARRLIRSRDRAVLSTVHGDRGGWPHGSLVLVACTHDATPLLFISDLAEHTRNIKHDPRVSLLFDGTEGLDDPLTGARAAVLGRCLIEQDGGAKARFLARHPSAGIYAGFADFNLYRVEIEAAHVVAGFGRINWVTGDDVRSEPSAKLAEREADIIEHMNEDHAEALQAYAAMLLGLEGEGWRMTGCDSEGIDLRLGGKIARLDFQDRVVDAAGARTELVRLAKQARGVPGLA
jgi:putative heme iron utilization protein